MRLMKVLAGLFVALFTAASVLSTAGMATTAPAKPQTQSVVDQVAAKKKAKTAKKSTKKAKKAKKKGKKKAKAASGRCGAYMYYSKKSKKCVDARNVQPPSLAPKK